MAMLELVHTAPDWTGALGVALSRPPGVPERRHGDDPWHDDQSGERPRVHPLLLGCGSGQTAVSRHDPTLSPAADSCALRAHPAASS